MLELAYKYRELNQSERSLLNQTFKTLIGARRQSVRKLKNLVQTDEKQNVPSSLEFTTRMVPCKNALEKRIKQEIIDMCCEALTVLKDVLYPCTHDDVVKVTYLSMIADYHRYKTENQEGDKSKSSRDNALVFPGLSFLI